MVHYPGFFKKLSKITKISEDDFPLLDNYIGDYYQLGFYFNPYPTILRRKRKGNFVICQVGGFTAHLNKPIILPGKIKTYSPYFINLYSLYARSLEVAFHPKYYFPVLCLRFRRIVESFIKFQLHEYFHIIGISEKGIRALRKMSLDV